MCISVKIAEFCFLLVTLPSHVMSDSVVDIRFDLSNRAEVSQRRPDWISSEVWSRYCLNRQVAVNGGSVFLRVVACQSANSRHLTLFLKNESTQSITLRLHPPDTMWKFTGQGGEVVTNKTEIRSDWRLEPSMPLPLPREMVLEPRRLIMVQITDMTPRTD